MNNIDWNYLKNPIIFLTASLICAILLTLVGQQYEAAQLNKYNQAVSTLQTAHTRYLRLVNDIDLIDQYRNLYSGYKSSGLVGDERRLSWIESLEGANKVLRLPKLTYNLLPQDKFERPGLVAKTGVEVKSSPMELSMNLLHEEDIFAILEGLRQSISNLFTVDSCTLSRQSGVGASLNTKDANLSSLCKIRWVTINVK